MPEKFQPGDYVQITEPTRQGDIVITGMVERIRRPFVVIIVDSNPNHRISLPSSYRGLEPREVPDVTNTPRAVQPKLPTF